MHIERLQTGKSKSIETQRNYKKEAYEKLKLASRKGMFVAIGLALALSTTINPGYASSLEDSTTPSQPQSGIPIYLNPPPYTVNPDNQPANPQGTVINLQPPPYVVNPWQGQQPQTGETQNPQPVTTAPQPETTSNQMPSYLSPPQPDVSRNQPQPVTTAPQQEVTPNQPQSVNVIPQSRVTSNQPQPVTTVPQSEVAPNQVQPNPNIVTQPSTNINTLQPQSGPGYVILPYQSPPVSQNSPLSTIVLPRGGQVQVFEPGWADGDVFVNNQQTFDTGNPDTCNIKKIGPYDIVSAPYGATVKLFRPGDPNYTITLNQEVAAKYQSGCVTVIVH